MTPTEAFHRMRAQWLSNTPTFDGDLMAEDVVVETPFAPPGRPRRLVGRAANVARAEVGRAALPVRFDDCRHVMIHETTDPEVIVVEYELVGTHTGTGVTASAPFIGVLRMRDGRIAHWREYQDHAAIAAAVSQPTG
ncbi:nuclear transport factor 2 family protein [Plantactinospora siamensis]|uniref:Nuclear transport factor 2 family protein n=1 Tax=Plantactinospora siamensis TaxID=555372 RepID=A0ABV6NZI4_9ACTN